MKNLIIILCLCLFWFSCDSLTETESNEIDVDWVLVKTLNMESMISDPESSNESIIDDGDDDGGEEGDELNEENDVIGYYFYFTNCDITNLNIEEIPDKFGLVYVEDGILSFTYNGEEFNFDVSDSYNLAYDLDGNLLGDFYLIHSQLNEPLQRILYNQQK